MQQLIEMILSGNLRVPALTPDLVALDQEMAKTDLLALLMLHRRGEATMSELAADLGVPLSTTTGIGARLTRKRLIERERSAEDRRVIVNRLTPAGRELAITVQQQINAIIQRVTGVLTPDEVAQLMTLVQKVLHAFQGEGLFPATAPTAPAAEATSQQSTSPQPRKILLDE